MAIEPQGPQGINRSFYDLGNFLIDTVKNVGGVRRGVGQSLGNVGRYFTSQAPVNPNFGPLGNTAKKTIKPGKVSTLDSYMYNKKIKQPTPLTPTKKTGNAAQRFGIATGGAGSAGGGGGNGINAMFAPLFKLIESQRAAADARYAANKGNIETIYGQLTSARRNDVASTAQAYKALSDAASSRSTAVSQNIDASEAQRLSANDAVLESLGLSDVASARMGDVASEQAATAGNVEDLNSSNWQGMLSAMQGNAQDVIGQDIQSYGYQTVRDVRDLQTDLQNYQQALDTRQFETQAKKAEVKFQFNQAQKAAQAAAAASAARASASANNAANKAASARVQALVGSADPLTRALATSDGLGLKTVNVTKVQKAYNSWMIKRGSNPTVAGLKSWSKVTATGDALKYTKGQLNLDEQRVLNDAISNSF